MKIISKIYYIVIISIYLTSILGLASEENTYISDLPDIPLPNQTSQKRLYKQMQTRHHPRSPQKKEISKPTFSSHNLNLDSSPHIKNNTNTYKPKINVEKKVKKSHSKKYLFPYLEDKIEPIKQYRSEKKDYTHVKILPKQKKNKPLKRKIIAYKKITTLSKPILKKRNSKKNISPARKIKKNKEIILADITSPNTRSNKFEKKWRKLLKNSRAVPGFPKSIEPELRGPYQYSAPEYYRGIYVNNGVARRFKKFKRLLKHSKKYGINVLVIDVQPKMPSKKIIKFARESGFYLVSRVVVFPGGLKKYPPSKRYIDKIAKISTRSAESGFMEVQLDYIRFTDFWKGAPISKRQRFRTVATIIKYITQKVRPYGLRIGADIFGRIPFNHNDKIGQNMEVFALHLDTIYPMLYPSHFYGEKNMQNKPYKPVYLGTKKAVKRVGHKSKIIPYIQAFRIHVKQTKLGYTNYIYRQLLAAKESGGSGFVAWNARSRYKTFFKALKKLNKKENKKLAHQETH